MSPLTVETAVLKSSILYIVGKICFFVSVIYIICIFLQKSIAILLNLCYNTYYMPTGINCECQRLA